MHRVGGFGCLELCLYGITEKDGYLGFRVDHSPRWSPTPTRPTKCSGTQAWSSTLIGQDQPTHQNPVSGGISTNESGGPCLSQARRWLGHPGQRCCAGSTTWNIFNFFLQNIFRFNHLMLAVNASINILIYVSKVIIRNFQALLSLVELLYYCALIGRGLHQKERNS